MKKIHFSQKLKELAQHAKKHGINLNFKSDLPLEFDNGEPSTPIQKKVADNFNEIVSRHAERAHMTRREFLKTPLGLAAATMAVSTGIGVSVFPTRADGKVFEGGVYDFMCWGHPLTPNLSLGDPLEPPEPNPYINPKGKLALVIGGSTGIGRRAADKLHALGWTVIGTSRTPETIPDEVGRPTPFRLWRLDIAKERSINRFVRRVQKFLDSDRNEHKHVDLLICNAGRFFLGRPLQSSRESQRLATESKLEGHITLVPKVIPMMPTEGYARLLFTGGIDGYAYSTVRFPITFDNEGNPVDFLNFSALVEAQNREAAALTRYGVAIKAEQENSKNPAVVDRFMYPSENTNITVSVLHPMGVDTTGFITDTIFGEVDDNGQPLPHIQKIFDFLVTGFEGFLISDCVAGSALVQMAMLKEETDERGAQVRPYLETFIADLTANPEEEPDKYFTQLFQMIAIAEEQEKTVRSLTTQPDITIPPPDVSQFPEQQCPEPAPDDDRGGKKFKHKKNKGKKQKWFNNFWKPW